jgi:ABC-type cobalamin/Fe3+-siderophores transport system ATPase subunit
MKLSKSAKARLKRMSSGERKAVIKAAALLADCEIISNQRFAAIHRTTKSC